ncbi:hypothetical protein P7C70_g4917, partial [Phenoliferia sp. Uapishka_3]
MHRKALVIGAGSSGLAALSELRSKGIDTVAIEARNDVGGQWNFEAPGKCSVRFDEGGRCVVSAPGDENAGGPMPPTAMYESLRCNVPTTLMAYRDEPFPYDTPLFPDAETVNAYLSTSAKSLRPHIIFNHRVISLRWTTPADEGDQREWICEYKSILERATPKVEQFDFVVVANGHYTEPYIPLISGLDGWKGKIGHSRWYRDPEAYRDQTVLVIGNSASGYDITRQIAEPLFDRRSPDIPAESLPKIYQSRKGPSSLGLPFDAPDSAEWAKAIGIFPPIERIEGKTIWFEDGRSLNDVDLIMFATGHLYSFPFASPLHAPFTTHPLTISPFPACSTPCPPGGLRVHNIDRRQLFYLPSPTLSFLALPLLVIPFPLAQAQSHLLAAFYSSSLPEPLKLEEGIPEDSEEERKGHVWGYPREFDEQDLMLKEAGHGGDGGKWGRAENGRRDLRVGSMALRKAVLKY